MDSLFNFITVPVETGHQCLGIRKRDRDRDRPEGVVEITVCTATCRQIDVWLSGCGESLRSQLCSTTSPVMSLAAPFAGDARCGGLGGGFGCRMGGGLGGRGEVLASRWACRFEVEVLTANCCRVSYLLKKRGIAKHHAYTWTGLAGPSRASTAYDELAILERKQSVITAFRNKKIKINMEFASIIYRGCGPWNRAAHVSFSVFNAASKESVCCGQDLNANKTTACEIVDIAMERPVQTSTWSRSETNSSPSMFQYALGLLGTVNRTEVEYGGSCTMS